MSNIAEELKQNLGKVSRINVPSDYQFAVKCHISDTILVDMYTFWKWNGIRFSANRCAINPSTDFYCVEDILIWIYNQHKSGYIYLYFKSNEDFDKLQKMIVDKKNEKNNKNVPINNQIYSYCPFNGWRTLDQNGTKNADKDIFGHDDYICRIEKDVKNHINYNSFLRELGEVRSNNYLLYGPPGTGKTSVVKAIAAKLGCCVFIVNAANVNISNIGNILNPNIAVKSPCKIKLLLFKDFDRFWGIDKVDDKIMGQIIKSLDGLDDKDGDTVRFFAANNSGTIFGLDTLINRMSGKYKFEMPTIEIFRGKLHRFLSFYETYDTEKAERLLELVMTKHITVRPFINFVIRYLFHENCLDVMIKKIDELN